MEINTWAPVGWPTEYPVVIVSFFTTVVVFSRNSWEMFFFLVCLNAVSVVSTAITVHHVTEHLTLLAKFILL